MNKLPPSCDPRSPPRISYLLILPAICIYFLSYSDRLRQGLTMVLRSIMTSHSRHPSASLTFPILILKKVRSLATLRTQQISDYLILPARFRQFVRSTYHGVKVHHDQPLPPPQRLLDFPDLGKGWLRTDRGPIHHPASSSLSSSPS
jgi:hypothetical protein